jgi:hypothetical protein
MGAAVLPVADLDAVCGKIWNRETMLAPSKRLSLPDKKAMASPRYQIRPRGVRITVKSWCHILRRHRSRVVTELR